MRLSELTGRAAQEAERLGHAEIDPDHFVLALFHAESDSAAGSALRACGASYGTFLRELERLPNHYFERKGTPVAPGGRIVGLSGTSLLACARGLALGLGSLEVRPEHVLTALIWSEPEWVANNILNRLGATRERIRAELELRDVDMPQVPFPRRRVWGDWRPISREQLDQLGAELKSKNIQYRVTYKDDHPLVSVESKADNN